MANDPLLPGAGGPDEAPNEALSLVLARLAESFFERYERGERPSIEEYAARHPELADEIRRLLPALLLMEEAGSRASDEATRDEPQDGAGTPPESLGDYRIVREIGRGGMGVVYEAVEETLRRRVALKVLPRGGPPRRVERFLREARTAARLHHTNIVPVFAVGEHQGTHFYAMQFIEGRSLDRILHELRLLRREDGGAEASPAADLAAVVAQGLLSSDTGAVPRVETLEKEEAAVRVREGSSTGSRASARYFRNAARIGLQAAEALAYAHREGILHRDIKPSNLLLDTGRNAWVADFGLAKGDEGEDLTLSGDIVGTIRYMAPERFAGRTDGRSDVYALGLTLYELVTLQPAFEDGDRSRLMGRIVKEEPPRPRELNPLVPYDLETIVLKAIEKDPGHRYASATDLAADLRCFLAGEPIRARAVGSLERAWRWCRRNPAVASLTAAVALLLVSLAAGSLIAAALYRGQRDDAVAARGKALESQARAEKAERAQAMDLYRSYLAQARVSRLTGGNGFDLLRRARALVEGETLTAEKVLELRDEAIACLATPAVGSASEWEIAVNPIFYGLGFDGNAERFAIVDADGSVSLRRAVDGRDEGRLPGTEGPPWWYAWPQFAPGGRFLLVEYDRTTFDPNLCRVWDLEGARELCRFYSLGQAAIDPRGRRVAAASPDGAVRVFAVPASPDEGGESVPDAAELYRLGAGLDGARLRFDAAGERLACFKDTKLRLFDLDSREVIATLECERPQHDIAWSPDGRLVAAAGADGEVRVFDVEERVLRAVLRGHEGDVINVSFHPRGHRLLSTSWDHTSRIWEPLTGTELLRLEQGAAFSGGGRRLGVWKGAVLGLCDLEDAGVLHALCPRSVWRPTPLRARAEVYDVDFSPDGRLMATASGDGVRFWDLAGREAAWLTLGDVESVRFDPGGRWLWTFGELGLHRWPLAQDPGEVDTVWVGSPQLAAARTGAIWHRLSLDREGRLLAYVDRPSAAVTVIDCESLAVRQRWNVTGDVTGAVLSPDGRWVVVTYWNSGPAHALNLTARGVMVLSSPRELQGNHARSAAFSHDGRSLVVGFTTELLTWRVDDWEPTFTVPRGVEQSGVAPCAFRPQGDLLAVAREARAADLLDPETGRRLATLSAPHSEQFTRLRFSPDGSFLAAATSSRNVQLWDLARMHAELAGLGLAAGLPEIRRSDADGRPRVEVELEGAGGALEHFLGLEARAAEARELELTRMLFRQGPPAAAEVKRQAAAWLETFEQTRLRFPGTPREPWSAVSHRLEALRARVEPDRPRPRQPVNRSPAPEAAVPSLPVVLASSPYTPALDLATLLGEPPRQGWSRWQVRASDGDYLAQPVFDLLSLEQLTSATLPVGLILPRTTYWWRVAHFAGDGQVSRWSEETSFTTGDLGIEAVPFDLTAAFTRDVVFNPGDAEDDEFDPGSGDRPLLTVDGHDGTSADNPAVRCLPRDGRLGPHRLGDYSRPNSIQLGMGGPPVRVEVPRRRYLALRFLLAAGWGDSRLAVSLESAGGVVKEATVTCNNWRNDIPPGGAADVMEGAWPVRRQLDHIRAGNLVNDSNGVLFEAWLAVDPRQELATIVFLPKRSWFAHDRARANVLAITGVAVP